MKSMRHPPVKTASNHGPWLVPQLMLSRQQNPNAVRLSMLGEAFWLRVSHLAQQLNSTQLAQSAAERVLHANPNSFAGLLRLAHVLHAQKQYAAAVEFYQRLLAMSASHNANNQNFAVITRLWSSLANCYLFMDNLPRAFHAYQQALVACRGNTTDVDLWFGIAVLYDRCGVDNHALEGFAAVLRHSNLVDAATSSSQGVEAIKVTPVIREAYFRIASIFQHSMQRYDAAEKIFSWLSTCPPHPLSPADVQMQALLCQFLARTQSSEADACELLFTDQHEAAVQTLSSPTPVDPALLESIKTLIDDAGLSKDSPSFHPITLLFSNWIKHLASPNSNDTVDALRLLTPSKKATSTPPASLSINSLLWYFLGRMHLHRKEFPASYEAYQEAVYCDGQNVAFWNSIGILYLQIRQFRDALDAFSRAVHLNSNLWQVWWNLGILYEKCNNQISDALDAYIRASEIYSTKNSTEHFIMKRISILRSENKDQFDCQSLPIFEILPTTFVPRNASLYFSDLK